MRVLEVGVCGTDREIAAGHFGVPPRGSSELVLGHELLGVVERDAHGFSRGQLVTATVRRSCGRCRACAEGSPDSCLTGDYDERGITRLDGFARELVGEDPAQLVPLPAALGRAGVLAEPASVCARAIRHARAIGARQPWEPVRALVLGAGAVGMLATCLLRLEGFDVWTAALEPPDDPRAALAEALGARYASTAAAAVGELGAEAGGFDLVLEATGDADAMAAALGVLRRSGVACLLGIDPRERTVALGGRVLGVDLILGNRVVFGSVNARRDDVVDAVDALRRARARWPEALDAFVGLRVPLDRFADAFGFRGVKATLVLDDHSTRLEGT
ncbi:MAG TPA: alcohol dehydrogenase catalytic domain-containing protein [Gaiellaceae bacterium]|nr:alcohol dehydrogenase catalytic domain-containing protein [Gaiellaceae bacterium]